ncbi:MAG: hypothetical protein WCJ35_24345 [Planctomycetota bacterium]
MPSIITRDLEKVCICPFCAGGRGRINLVLEALAAARLTKPSGLLFTSTELRDQPIVVFGDDGNAVEPCEHLVSIHGPCWWRPDDNGSHIDDQWEALIDWDTPFFQELDPTDLTIDFRYDVFDRKCDVGLRPTVPYECEWFDYISWWEQSCQETLEGIWKCDGQVVFAANPRLFVTELLEKQELYSRHSELIHAWRGIGNHYRTPPVTHSL